MKTTDADAVMAEGGQVLICPLCLKGTKGEVHLVFDCRALDVMGVRIVVYGSISLESMLQGLRHANPGSTSKDVIRSYLGQGHNLSRTQYIERSLALDLQVDHLFLK